MSEQFVEHPDGVGDETGALDSEPSLVLDEDRMEADPLEGGMDPADDPSRTMRLGGTQASEEPERLAYRIPQEEPDVVAEEPPDRPIAATPVEDLDESVDDPANSVDGVGPDGFDRVGVDDPLAPDGEVEAQAETGGRGEVELGLASAADAAEVTGLPSDDAVGATAAADRAVSTGGAEQQALRVEQES